MPPRTRLNRPALLCALRFSTAAAILGSVAWQIADRASHGLFRPAEYFAYFTIQASLLTAAALLAAGRGLLRGAEERPGLTRLRLTAAAASLVVAVVYNLLLRDAPLSPADANYPWPVPPNEVLHVWAPAAVLLDWLVPANARRLGPGAAFSVAIFPLAWLAVSVARGALDGWWPYWFLDPSGQGGITGMLSYILGITAFFIASGFALVGSQRLSKQRE